MLRIPPKSAATTEIEGILKGLKVGILCETRLKRGNYIQVATKGFVPKMRRTRSSSRLGSTLKSKFRNDPKNALEVDGDDDDDFVSPPTGKFFLFFLGIFSSKIVAQNRSSFYSFDTVI